MAEFNVKTGRRTQLVDITREVAKAVAAEGLKSGAVLVYCPHTTAGITINENADPDVVTDLEDALDRLVPWDGPYRHGEGNSAAHVKSTLVGASEALPVEGGRPVLGTWQGIYFCEFDGPRTRRVQVKPLSGA